MAPTGYRIRLMLIITAIALVVVNSLALWGDEPARRLVAALQFATGAGAVSYGLVTARRAHGASRTWRLLAVGTLASLMVAELAWWTNWAAVTSGRGGRLLPVPAPGIGLGAAADARRWCRDRVS